jgi:DNA-directed RNA polymerase subunit M/transcription elongation factor TFIIS
MDTLDPAGEFLRIAQRYRQMSDEELLVLVPEISELTSEAQRALASELQRRGIKVETADKKPTAKRPFRPPDSFATGYSTRPERDSRRIVELRDASNHDRSSGEFSDAGLLDNNSSDASAYDEDRELVNLCTVWSVRDALQLQTILDNNGIPFFMGPEKATGVDTVTSDFTKGVVVQVMRIGIPWARAAVENFFPEDDSTPEEPTEPAEVSVRCPRCHSDEVVFDELDGDPPKTEKDSSPKFKWTCDSCGNQWEDDGIVKD